MLMELLYYLSNPLFFTGFSLIIGVAYVYVWITSLRDLAREESALYSLDADSSRASSRQRPLLKYSGRRLSVRSKAVQEDEPVAVRGRRRARITRAA